MPLLELRLQHFRSYTDASFDLSEGVNIIVGPNATGKTNLLEAVLVLARGKSYRAKDIELVQFDQFADQTKQIDQAWARLDAHDQDGNVRTVKLQCTVSLKSSAENSPNIVGACKKSFEIEEKTFLRLSSQKSLPVVLFEPNHLLMLSGSPELRRSYLDDLLEQLVPRFGTMRRQYKRMLAQRNALLKQSAKQNTNYYQPISSEVRAQLFVWNVRLGELAGYVVRERLALIDQINAIASDIYGEISSNKNSRVQIEYISSLFANSSDSHTASLKHDTDSITMAANYETALLKRFEQTLERDIMLGYTTAGPHRDDLQVRLNGHLSQESASRGENRTIVLALKIIELQLMASSLDVQSPILLLDDVFSELDGKRRHALTNYLKTYQTFITTTDADVVVKHFTESSNIIPMQR